jgi:hypothetical protein
MTLLDSSEPQRALKVPSGHHVEVRVVARHRVLTVPYKMYRVRSAEFERAGIYFGDFGVLRRGNTKL